MLYIDGNPPDGTPRTVIHTYDTGLTGTYYTFASLGTVFAIGCLLFNFAYRKRKLDYTVLNKIFTYTDSCMHFLYLL